MQISPQLAVVTSVLQDSVQFAAVIALQWWVEIDFQFK
jgi:hypothetical protein